MPDRPVDFICVLRGTSRRKGLGPALRAHLERHPRWCPSAYWKAGIADEYGRVRDDYGFKLFVAEGNDWAKVRASMKRRLLNLVPLIRAYRKVGGKLSLDVAAMPGPRWFTRSVRLPPEDLRWLATLGLEWEVTAYAVSGPQPSTARSATKRPTRRTSG